MKRIIALILLAVMLITLSACNANPRGTETQMVLKNDYIVQLIFNYDEKTITASNKWNDTGEGNAVYRYEYDGGDITIFYPNGAVWIESPTSTGAVFSWDDEYDPQHYIDGEELARYLKEAYEGEKDQFSLTGGMLIGCLFLVAFGALLAYDPETMLHVRYQWRFKNVEPTKAAILETRIMGVFFIAVAVVFILLAIFL